MPGLKEDILTVSIESFLAELGIEYRIIDDEAFAPCPFHSPDRHPSWSVNISSGVHYCFSCGARGNLASLVSYIRGIAYPEAAIYVNQKVGAARIYKWREDYDNVSFSPMSVKISRADLALFIAPPEDKLADKRITAESAAKYNVMWNPVHESWIFPFYDPFSGELWGYQEKNARLFRNYPAGTRKSRTLFGIRNAINGCPGILVESPVDAVRIDSIGIRGGVSSFGIPSGSYQLTVVQHFTDEIVLALDNDTAGIRATRELLPIAARLFRTVRVYNYGESEAKDPGEQSDDEVQYGFSNSIPALKWRNK